MKQILILLLNTFILCNLYSQKCKYNCIVFVDGKMPRGVTNCYLSYKDSLNKLKTIDFEYTFGDIILSLDNSKLLQTISPEQPVEFHFTVVNHDGFDKSYSGEIDAGWLNFRYLIIRITNLRKGKYYFAYSTPLITKHWIRKEYRMLESSIENL